MSTGTRLNESRTALLEKEHAFLFDASLPRNVVAGFTKPHVKGRPQTQEDALTALAFTGRALKIAYMDQVHGSDVKIVDTPAKHVCDGIFTQARDLALVVKTADCLPLLFHSEKENVIGAVHMGWRSAKDGILDNIPYDLASFRVIAGIGLRRCCYQVGDDFLAHERFVPHLERRSNRCYFDPVAFAKKSLAARGLAAGNFIDLDICSSCSQISFPSHRKTGTPDRTLNFIAFRKIS
jgi:copper oxidase (laccase) domain-containing protein